MAKKRVLISWVGGNDLAAAKTQQKGPVLATLTSFEFDTLELLCNYPENEVKVYVEWLSTQTSSEINFHNETLSSPINLSDIYIAANKHLKRLSQLDIELNILLSPGTPAMQAIWMLLGKTKYQASFFQSSLEQGVQRIEIPFEISAEFIPAINQISAENLNSLASDHTLINPAFDNIITNNQAIKMLKAKGQVLAEKEVPVLIYGETGTGKELFARAIHNASSRSGKPFVAVNCGALQEDLIDSILFGHKKGSFTGAIFHKDGLFHDADGGTLFLDEFGELNASIQVRLLRVLQEGTFTPLGSSTEKRVNVRLITATHRDLLKLVSAGDFREDLFYRIAVGVLHLPPLRSRDGDLLFLSKCILQGLKDKDPSLEHKYFSASANNIILKHGWPGNVRELQSTILRATLWSSKDEISGEDVADALFKIPDNESILHYKDISQGIDLHEIFREISEHYIHEALKLTNQNKTRAAEMLGLKNYQTLSNWMDKYQIK